MSSIHESLDDIIKKQKLKDAKKKTKTPASKQTASTKTNGSTKTNSADKQNKPIKKGEPKPSAQKKQNSQNQQAKKTGTAKKPLSAKDVTISVANTRVTTPKAKKPATQIVKTVKPVEKPKSSINPHSVVIHVELPREPVKKPAKTSTETRNQRAATTKQEIQNKREVLMANTRAKKSAAPSSLSERFSQPKSR